MLTRRSFLASTAAGAVAAGCGTSGAAAFSLEPASQGVSKAYLAGQTCGKASAYHASLLADAEAVITGRAISAAEKENLIAALTCPICGCPLRGR